MPRPSLIDYLREYPKHGRSTAFVQRSGYRTSRWSYLEVANLAAQCAREFERLGIAPGDRILIWGRNSAEWVAAFFGCILRGAVAVPMDQGATADFAGRVAQQVDARLLLLDRENTLVGKPRPAIHLDSLREAVGQHPTEPYASPPLARSSIAQIIFTSGATGEPKGVVISHGNILANLKPLEMGIQPYLKWESFVHPLRFLNLVPVSHVFGQFMGVWIPPLLGGCVYFQDSLNPSEIISTIGQERVSVLIAVPRVLEALQSKIERDLDAEGALEAFRKDFDAAEKESIPRRLWRFRKIHRRFGLKFWAVISGGATLDLETERFWGRIGFAAIQGYGLTETTSLVSVNHPFRIGRGSIGKVLQGREVKLDANGEILVRGENIAAGYWSRTRGKRRTVRGSVIKRREEGETASPRRRNCRSRERVPGRISEDALVVSVARSRFSAHFHRQTEARRDSRVRQSTVGRRRWRRGLAGYHGGNRRIDRANRRRARANRCERKSRERSASQFARSRRAAWRNRRPLPGGLERNALCLGQNCR
jgi:long-chain acyl-CoA synthetase